MNASLSSIFRLWTVNTVSSEYQNSTRPLAQPVLRLTRCFMHRCADIFLISPQGLQLIVNVGADLPLHIRLSFSASSLM